MVDRTQTTAVPGPWVAESRIADDTEERGLAVLAVIPEVERIGYATPTRGMVAWVHSGIGACSTDDQAVATAHLIAAAPDMFAALIQARGALCLGAMVDAEGNPYGTTVVALEAITDAIAKARGEV